MKQQNDTFYHHKVSLGILLNDIGLNIMSKDIEVVDRIFNLLTENKHVEKIEGIISTAQIVKYGGEIDDLKVKKVFCEIKNWFATVNL